MDIFAILDITSFHFIKAVYYHISEPISIFLVGSIMTEWLVVSFIKSLYMVGKTKKERRDIKKNYNIFQRFLTLYIKFPIQYNNSIAVFWIVFRVFHYIFIVSVIITLFLITESNANKLLAIILNAKFFVIDLGVFIYAQIHNKHGFFKFSNGQYDFAKTKAEQKYQHKN